MSAHDCIVITKGCYRCELHLDEVREWAKELLVSKRRKVHTPDCHLVQSPATTAESWEPQAGDTACFYCLPDGIPEVVDAAL